MARKSKRRNQLANRQAQVAKVQAQALERRSEQRIEARFSGPLPPPGMLAGYDDAIPGSAARLIAAFEAEGQHRRELDRMGAETEIRLADDSMVFRRELLKSRVLGQKIAACALGGMLALAVFALYMNHPAVAGIAVTTTTAIVSIFALRRSPKAPAVNGNNGTESSD